MHISHRASISISSVPKSVCKNVLMAWCLKFFCYRDLSCQWYKKLHYWCEWRTGMLPRKGSILASCCYVSQASRYWSDWRDIAIQGLFSLNAIRFVFSYLSQNFNQSYHTQHRMKIQICLCFDACEAVGQHGRSWNGARRWRWMMLNEHSTLCKWYADLTLTVLKNHIEYSCHIFAPYIILALYTFND